MDQDTKDQLARQYQTSIEDIRLFKNTEWRIIAACYVIFGAIIGFSDRLKGAEWIACPLIVIVFIIVIAGIAVVYSTNRALSTAQDVIKRIRKKWQEEARNIIRQENIDKGFWFDRIIFPWIFYFAIVIAAAVTELFIFSILLKS